MQYISSLYLRMLALICASNSLPAVEHNIIIVAGQSNAVAVGTSAAQLTPDAATDAQIRLYSDTGQGSPAWTQLRPINGTFGPEITLARTLFHAGLHNLTVVKVAVGGSNLYLDWDKGNTQGQQLYQRLIQRMEEAIEELNPQETDTVSIHAIFWMQGETDAKSAKTDQGVGSPPPPQPQTAQNYGENLAAFLENLQNDLATPQLRLVLGRLGEIGVGPRHSTAVGYYEYLETVQTEQVAFAESNPLVEWVSTSDLVINQSDNIHFSSASIETLGNRFAEAYFRAPAYQFASWTEYRPGFAQPERIDGSSAANDDPDQDRLVNLWEFALGLDPTTSDLTAEQYEISLQPDSLNQIVITWPRNPHALGLLTDFEISTDLKNWMDAQDAGWQLIAGLNFWKLQITDMETNAFLRARLTLTEE